MTDPTLDPDEPPEAGPLIALLRTLPRVAPADAVSGRDYLLWQDYGAVWWAWREDDYAFGDGSSRYAEPVNAVEVTPAVAYSDELRAWLLAEEGGLYGWDAVNSLPRHVSVWRYADAPVPLRALSTNGGDEDWLVYVPAPAVEGFEEFGPPTWVEVMDSCREPQRIALPGGAVVYVGSHA